MRRGNKASGTGPTVKALGWFSVALGVTQILAPRRLSKVIGVKERPMLMRILGIRETLSGIGILAQDRQAPWLWSRVAGDGMNLALLGMALSSHSSSKAKVLAATTAVTGVTAADVLTSLQMTRGAQRFARSVITVNCTQREAYEFWSYAENLPKFIKSISGEYEVLITRPYDFIEWRSTDGKAVRAGYVSFTPAMGRDGTEVQVEAKGMIISTLLHEDLRRFKRLIETGEIPTTEGQPAGPSSSALIAPLIRRLEGKEIA